MSHKSVRPVTHLRESLQRFGRPERSLQDLRRRLATGAGAILLGLAAILFAKLADASQRLFLDTEQRWPDAALFATPAVFAVVVWITDRWFPAAKGSGIPQIIAATDDPSGLSTGPLLSLRTSAAKCALTLAMLFVGGSVGREGPTVQVSTTIMVWLHRLFRVPITAGVLIAGGAAGVAAAFNTPLAGVAFAIEELASAYEQRVAVLVMAAVMISGLVSLGVAGDYLYFGAMHQATLGVGSVLELAPVCGIIGGLAGGVFARTLLVLGHPRSAWLRRVKAHPVLLALVCGGVVALMGRWTGGATWGTGYAPTRALIEGHGGEAWFGLTKFVATTATAITGAPGGIFAPSLSVGAGIGHAISFLFPDAPAGAIALLGMIAYFVGAVRAPLTAVIIVMETTASRGMILPLFATALIADAVSALVCREKLYHGLSRAFLPPGSGQAVQEPESETPVQGK